jgi:hypothetical protein
MHVCVSVRVRDHHLESVAVQLEDPGLQLER